MRIFLHEHVLGGGLLGEVLPASLAAEGRAMLETIGADLAALPGVSVVSAIDARIAAPAPRPGWQLVRIDGERDAGRAFDSLAATCSGVLLIAPELDGVLARLARRVEALGGRLLGPSAAAIEAASDKLLLPRLLAAAGVPAVPAEPCRQATRLAGSRVVIKPRRGAGSTGVRLLREGEAVPDLPDAIATPYLPGRAASVLCIVHRGGVLPLRAGEQLLSADGAFGYEGGRIPLAPQLEERAASIARRALAALPGLLGFAGVDLILGADPPGDAVIEVNARLTTSYVGLRALAADNLAASWHEAVDGDEPTAPAWHPGAVRFTPAGGVQLASGDDDLRADRSDRTTRTCGGPG